MFLIKEPLLTLLLPDLKICSNELSLSGMNHILVCDYTTTVLHCYAQLYALEQVACETFIIIGSYNFV